MSKRVAHIVLNDFVNDNRVLKECNSLIDAGYEVSVFALKTERTQAHQRIGKIDVHRVKLWTEIMPSSWNPIKYLEFMFRMQRKLRGFDIIQVNDFEPFPTAALHKMFRPSVKIVYDSHEYQSEKNGMGNFTRRLIRFLEPRLIKKAEAVITVSQGIRQEYERLYGLKDIEVIFNAPHRMSVKKRNLFRRRFNLADDTVIFLYQGKFHKGRGVEKVIEAFAKLEGEKVAVVFMGNGPLEDLVRESAKKYNTIFLHEAVPYEVILEHTASADFGLLTTENICLNHYYCMPNKLFEYIQAGLPVITTPLYDCKNMVDGLEIGFVLDEDSVDGYLGAIRKARTMPPGQFDKALKIAADHYHWAVEEQKLLGIYSRL
ncbi:MAG: glycosyltransferase family 4 protein [Flavobacteriales bacterium]|nr:glycosyltransferase family 4 protein [Flavobacteriales bacterium]